VTAISDPRRALGNVIQLGTVDTVDLSEATCRVRVGDIVTGDLPWLSARAGATRIWSPPSVGEQVVVLCPEGDMEAALVWGGLWSDARPAPAEDAGTAAVFADEARIGYEPGAHELDIILPSGGTIHVDAAGGVLIDAPVTIKGDVSIQGDVQVTGKLTASDDVVGGGKSLKGHKHTGVQAGGAISGPPQ